MSKLYCLNAGKADGVRRNLWGHIQVYYGGKWYDDYHARLG